MYFLPYIVSCISGMMYGFFELIIVHRRMKREAIDNIWGICYILWNMVLSFFTFLVLMNSNIFPVNISNSPDLKMWILSMSSGPLFGVVIRHIGGRSKDS